MELILPIAKIRICKGKKYQTSAKMQNKFPDNPVSNQERTSAMEGSSQIRNPLQRPYTPQKQTPDGSSQRDSHYSVRERSTNGHFTSNGGLSLQNIAPLKQTINFNNPVNILGNNPIIIGSRLGTKTNSKSSIGLKRSMAVSG